MIELGQPSGTGRIPWWLAMITVATALVVAGCGGGETPAGADGGGRGGGRGGGGGFGGFGGAAAEPTAIPVEVATVGRRDVADYLETTGVLEAEREVDVVARTSGPITSLSAEEGDFVREGQVLATIDDAELRAQLAIARVTEEEARVALERAKASHQAEIISQETFDQAKSRYDGARAQIRGIEIQLSYTQVTAPFTGRIIERVIKFQEYVGNGSRLFRISDFDPLLCPIQIPEKDLTRVRVGQPAYVTVESYPDQRFRARVLRINPVIEAGSGTVKVTLEVAGESRLRPGMFASVHLETDVHSDALVIPKRALVLESIGDTVYVFADGVAQRREVELGFEDADAVEILDGLEEGERVVVVGQDSLSQGTPIYLLGEGSAQAGGPGGQGRPGREQGEAGQAGSGGPVGSGGGSGVPGGRNIDWDDPAQVERVRGSLRMRGLTDEQIEERIEQMKRGEGPRGRRPSGDRPPSGDASSGV